jgi:large subunit ribosomal protein L29
MALSELASAALDQKREQFNLRMAKAQGQLTQTHEIRLTRRMLARINTIMAEKAKAGEA